MLALGGMGLRGINAPVDDLAQVKQTGDAAMHAARMNAVFAHVRRLEFRAATDRSADIGRIRSEIGAFQARYRESLEAIRQHAGPRRQAVLAQLAPAAERYLAGVARTLAAAERQDAAAQKRLVVVVVAASLIVSGLLVWLIGARAIAASIAAAVEQQGAATAEIARNAQQAAAGTGAVSANIGSVQEAASGSGAAAAQVQGAAAELSRCAEALRTQVEHFLAEMKAA